MNGGNTLIPLFIFTVSYKVISFLGVLAGDYDFNNFATSNFQSSKFSAVHKDNLLDLNYLDDITVIKLTILSINKTDNWIDNYSS